MQEKDESRFYNTALYIDYENVYWNLRREKTNVIRLGFFEKIRAWCAQRNRRLVKIAAYCNFDHADLHESYHQSLLQSYGVETIHTSNQGKNFADLQITVDVLNAVYQNNNIDEFIIMSNDRDMTPVLSAIRFNKRKATILTTGQEYNRSLTGFADEQLKLADILETQVEHLILEDIEEQLSRNFREYVNKSLSDYVRASQAYANGEITRLRPFQHYGVIYGIDTRFRNYRLMRYEVATVVSQWNRDKKVIFYKYTFKHQEYLAMFPAELKEELLGRGIISESDLVDYDMDRLVDIYYEQSDPHLETEVIRLKTGFEGIEL